MVSDYVFDEVWLVGFLWLYVLQAWTWPRLRLRRGLLAPPPVPPRRQRANASTPFPGLMVKPS